VGGFGPGQFAPSSEVASVKPANPPVGPHVASPIANRGRLNIEAAELRQIVGLAYAIQRVHVRWEGHDGPIPTISISSRYSGCSHFMGARTWLCALRTK